MRIFQGWKLIFILTTGSGCPPPARGVQLHNQEAEGIFFRDRLAVVNEMWLQGRSAEKSRIEKCHRVALPNEMWLQGRSAEKSRIEKRCLVAVAIEMWLQARSAEKSRTEKRGRVAVPNEMWLQRRGATQNEKLNSPPDHHRSLPTLYLTHSFKFIFWSLLSSMFNSSFLEINFKFNIFWRFENYYIRENHSFLG